MVTYSSYCCRPGTPLHDTGGRGEEHFQTQYGKINAWTSMWLFGCCADWRLYEN